MQVCRNAPVLVDIVEEHFEELDFLSELREGSLRAREWTLADLAQHEERMEAHLDGLRVAGSAALELAREALGGGAPHAATLVLCAFGDNADRTAVLAILAGEDVDASLAVARALRYPEISPYLPSLRTIYADAALGPAIAAFDVLAFHRCHVSRREDLFAIEVPLLACTVFDAAGRTGTLTRGDLEHALQHSDETVRATALRAGAMLGHAHTTELARRSASRPTDPDPAAVRFLGVVGEPSDLPLLVTLVRNPTVGPAALGALGALGDMRAIPVLLEAMDSPQLGPAAVDAYRRMTGADDIEGERPLLPAGTLGDPEADLEALPPDRVKATADWQRRASQLASGVRIQMGREVPVAWTPLVHDTLPLDVRYDSWLRAMLARGGVPARLEPEARVRAQLEAYSTASTKRR